MVLTLVGIVLNCYCTNGNEENPTNEVDEELWNNRAHHKWFGLAFISHVRHVDIGLSQLSMRISAMFRKYSRIL
jgi:hypothetical protein